MPDENIRKAILAVLGARNGSVPKEELESFLSRKWPIEEVREGIAASLGCAEIAEKSGYILSPGSEPVTGFPSQPYAGGSSSPRHDASVGSGLATVAAGMICVFLVLPMVRKSREKKVENYPAMTAENAVQDSPLTEGEKEQIRANVIKKLNEMIQREKPGSKSRIQVVEALVQFSSDELPLTRKLFLFKMQPVKGAFSEKDAIEFREELCSKDFVDANRALDLEGILVIDMKTNKKWCFQLSISQQEFIKAPERWHAID